MRRKHGMGFIQGLCLACGKNVQAMEGKDKQGRQKYKKFCHTCMYGDKRYPHRKFKKDICEECGFIPKHPRQLDVHHLDMNKKNNEESNLVTLCANCHRLIHI